MVKFDLKDNTVYETSHCSEAITYTSPNNKRRSLTVSFSSFTDCDEYSSSEHYIIEVKRTEKPRLRILSPKEEILYSRAFFGKETDTPFLDWLKKDISLADYKDYNEDIEKLVNQARKTIVIEGWDKKKAYEEEKERQSQAERAKRELAEKKQRDLAVQKMKEFIK